MSADYRLRQRRTLTMDNKFDRRDGEGESGHSQRGDHDGQPATNPPRYESTDKHGDGSR